MANKTGNLRISQEQFIIRANNKHKFKYNYDLSIFTGIHKKVIIICPIHGAFEQSAASHINHGNGCQKCAKIERGLSKRTKLEEFIIRSNKLHKNKYLYDLVKLKTHHDNITIICPIHGKFLQSPSNHLSGRGCTKCKYITIGNKTRGTLEEFVLKSKNIWGNKFDYSKSEYLGSSKKLIIRCNKHNLEFEQSPSNHYTQIGCKLCARRSKGERVISKWLDNNKIKYEMEKRFDGCKMLNSKNFLRFDFYISILNLLIEYDGEQHFRPLNKYKGIDCEFEKIKLRDEFKNKWVKDNGYNLLRIPYFEFKNINKILDRELNNVIC